MNRNEEDLMAEVLTRYWGKIRCWICLGEGWVLDQKCRKVRCSNKHCPHVQRTLPREER